jgi:hypothetical protein
LPPDELGVLRIFAPIRIDAERKRRVAWVEKHDIALSLTADLVQDSVDEVSVGVENTYSEASRNVLQDEALQQSGLAGAGGPDNVESSLSILIFDEDRLA